MKSRILMACSLLALGFLSGWLANSLVSVPSASESLDVSVLVDEDNMLVWFFCQGLEKAASYKLSFCINYSLRGPDVLQPLNDSLDVVLYIYAYAGVLVVLYDYGHLSLAYSMHITGVSATLSRFS